MVQIIHKIPNNFVWKFVGALSLFSGISVGFLHICVCYFCKSKFQKHIMPQNYLNCGTNASNSLTDCVCSMSVCLRAKVFDTTATGENTHSIYQLWALSTPLHLYGKIFCEKKTSGSFTLKTDRKDNMPNKQPNHSHYITHNGNLLFSAGTYQCSTFVTTKTHTHTQRPTEPDNATHGI